MRDRDRSVVGRPGLVLLGAALLVLAVGLALLLSRDPHPTSAEMGREGVRTLSGAPDDLPSGIVPSGAIEVEGTVARSGDRWTANVTYVVAEPLEAASERVDGVLTAAGYRFRQRSYDDTSLQARYGHADGGTLTASFEEQPDGTTGVAVILQGTRPPGA